MKVFAPNLISERFRILVPAFFFLWLLLSAAAARAEGYSKSAKPAVVIDVRTPAEFATGHIKGAINLPVDQIGNDMHSLQGISKDSPILLYCRTGGRAERAKQILTSQGYTQVTNGGGFADLSRALPSCLEPGC